MSDPDPELDDLLEDALDDFDRVVAPAAAAAAAAVPGGGDEVVANTAALRIDAAEGALGLEADDKAEFAVDEFQRNLEAMMQSLSSGGPPPAATEPAAVAASGALQDDLPPVQLEEQLKRTLEQLNECAASLNVNSADDSNGNDDDDELDENEEAALRTLLAQMGAGAAATETASEGDAAAGGGGGGGGDDEGALNNMMKSMVSGLLSRELIYDPIKDLRDRFGPWLEANRTGLTADEIGRYTRQIHCIESLCGLYEREEAQSSATMDSIDAKITLLQEMQSYGQPPNGLLREMGVEFDAEGQPKVQMIPSLPSGGAAGCTVM